MKPKLFDEDKVLEIAFGLFWQHGSDGTSIKMLEDATGLGRSSIYHTFETKQELFRRALAHYLKKMALEYQTVFAQSTHFKEGLVTIFKHITDDRRPPGCLLVLSTLELEQHEDATRTLIAHAHTQMRQLFYNFLLQAQSRGEIPAERDIQALSETLYIFINGLLVANKIRFMPSEAVIELVTQMIN